MQHIFISMPMNGLSDTEINNKFEEITNLVKGKYFVIPSRQTIFKNISPVYYLGHSLILLSRADAVLFSDGWEKARGCKIEHQVATEYDIPILYEKDLYENDL